MRKPIILLVAMVCCIFINTSEVKAAPEIIVSKTTQQLAYWDNETLQVYLICPVSTGINDEDTPEGVFKTSDYYPQWHALYYNQWAYGAIRINKDILLHSVPYFLPDLNALDLKELEKLGTPASHGCIRMSTENILLLTQIVPKGTRVVVIH